LPSPREAGELVAGLLVLGPPVPERQALARATLEALARIQQQGALTKVAVLAKAAETQDPTQACRGLVPRRKADALPGPGACDNSEGK
jgi:hypothetical protein